MHSNMFRFAWGLSLLVAAALGCNLINVVPNELRDAAGTAQSLATQIGTQSESLATAFQEGLGTAQAIATQEGPSILATGRAALTEAAESGVLQTAQAKITQEASQAIATLQALGTQGLSPGEPGDDVPIIEDPEPADLFRTSSTTISYTTSLPLQEVLDFYKQEMTARGWVLDPDSSLETEGQAVLWYDRGGRVASVTLSAAQGGGTSVFISIVPR